MNGPIIVPYGGIDYALPPFNVGQRRRVALALASAGQGQNLVTVGFDIVAIAFERAAPAPLKYDELMPSQEEFENAMSAILAQNGLAPKAGDATTGEAPAPAA